MFKLFLSIIKTILEFPFYTLGSIVSWIFIGIISAFTKTALGWYGCIILSLIITVINIFAYSILSRTQEPVKEKEHKNEGVVPIINIFKKYWLFGILNFLYMMFFCFAFNFKLPHDNIFFIATNTIIVYVVFDLIAKKYRSNTPFKVDIFFTNIKEKMKNTLTKYF